MSDDRVYQNEGNPPLIDMLSDAQQVLDVGCGAGDNARLILSRMPECRIYGITHSEPEALIAGKWMRECWVIDLETALPDHSGQPFDAMVFSHVLEHLRHPDEVLHRYGSLLKKGGEVLIAIPNILSWRMRIQFLLGGFEYQSSGVLDDTHLRFFTYFTADRFLLSKSPEFELISKTVTGSVPLWFLRRHILPASWRERIDNWGCRHWPNLFGYQILLKLVKRA
jgi:2-polyprenyl-3-methyl-5-hydroxy-6-metoxy-1,4-benzoquinol methylase